VIRLNAQIACSPNAGAILLFLFCRFPLCPPCPLPPRSRGGLFTACPAPLPQPTSAAKNSSPRDRQTVILGWFFACKVFGDHAKTRNFLGFPYIYAAPHYYQMMPCNTITAAIRPLCFRLRQRLHN